MTISADRNSPRILSDFVVMVWFGYSVGDTSFPVTRNAVRNRTGRGPPVLATATMGRGTDERLSRGYKCFVVWVDARQPFSRPSEPVLGRCATNRCSSRGSYPFKGTGCFPGEFRSKGGSSGIFTRKWISSFCYSSGIAQSPRVRSQFEKRHERLRGHPTRRRPGNRSRFR